MTDWCLGMDSRELQGCLRVSLLPSYMPVAFEYPTLLTYDPAPPPGTFSNESSPKGASVAASFRPLYLVDQGKKLVRLAERHLPFHHSAFFLFPAQHPPSSEPIHAFDHSVYSVGTSSKLPEVLSSSRSDAGAKVKLGIGPKNLCKVLYEPNSCMRFDQAHQQQSSNSVGSG